MAFHAPDSNNQDDAGGLGTHSEIACQVCGHRAFSEDTPHEFAQGLTDRLFCLACGAHRHL